MRAILLSLVLFLAVHARAFADPVDDMFAKHIAAGSYVTGAIEIEALGGPKAHAAAGVIRFGGAIEALGQALYRHGLQEPRRGAMLMTLPVLRMPVPVNPNPQALKYQDFRAILEQLVSNLDAADTHLAKLGDEDTKLALDLAQVAFDFDADGKRSPDESLAVLLSALMQGSGTPPATLSVNFDTADVYWLRGYGRFISGFAQFMLAHNFEGTFDKTFHLFFPKSGLPLGRQLTDNTTKLPNELTGMNDTDTIGDAIAFIHLLNWETVDPARLKDARVRWLDMTHLSPQSWAAARRETDNDREWLPNAKQTQALTSSTNSDEIIDSWLSVMTEFGDVLDGRKAMPHWRFDKGMNVKKFFSESKRFDLMLLLTGTDAVVFLDDTPVSTTARWQNLTSAFRGNFLGYAVWFN